MTPATDVAEYIEQLMRTAPPLTPEQRARLAVLLQPIVPVRRAGRRAAA